MSESKDTTIKLFGKTIISLFVAKHHDDDDNDHDNDDDGLSSSYSSSCCPSFEPDKVKNNNNQTDLNEEPKTTSEISSSRSSKNNGDQQSEITTITSNKKTLKKPDEILQCPRCKSNETKFCYYNNYNVNQPRHFCKNCQRYWTAGGSMRNVPIGSGRRKNKGWASSSSSSNQYFQINPEIKNNDSVNVKVNSSDKGLLHPQVTPPWSYQWSSAIPNGNFYPMPFYWGCTIPVWSSNSFQCEEKRKRDQMESKDSEIESSRSFVRSKLAIRSDQERDFVSDTSLALQANPAALARSMNFHESTATVSD